MSFIRLKQRSTVLLPQPDGPMNAVISCGRIFSVHLAHSLESAVVDGEVVDIEHRAGRRRFLDRPVVAVSLVSVISCSVSSKARERGAVVRSRSMSSDIVLPRPRQPCREHRATTVKRNARAIRVSAAPHARSCAVTKLSLALP